MLVDTLSSRGILPLSRITNLPYDSLYTQSHMYTQLYGKRAEGEKLNLKMEGSNNKDRCYMHASCAVGNFA